MGSDCVSYDIGEGMIERACGLEYGYAAVGKPTNLGMLQGYIRLLSTGPDLLLLHSLDSAQLSTSSATVPRTSTSNVF